MSTDDNDAYGDLDKSNLKFIYEQFLQTQETKGGVICSNSKKSPHWLWQAPLPSA